MLEITSHRQGAVLNHNHGKESEKSLLVRIEGISDGGWPVKVNGCPGKMDGRRFVADVELTQQFNEITAEVVTPFGKFLQELVLVWDKKSFRRFNSYIDDCSFLFTDLAKERPEKAFDHFFLKGLKAIHDKYDWKVTLNAFYHNDHEGNFTLAEMPDIWKSEFEKNADWLKFSFHSYGEFPDRAYLEASAEDVGRDWDLVQREIERFAGKASFHPPVNSHWANVHPTVAAEMIRRGVRYYIGTFRPRVMGGPSLADRMKGGNMTDVQNRSCCCGNPFASNEALGMHYGFQEETDYLQKHYTFYDPTLGVFFIGASVACCNLVPLDKIHGRYLAAMKRAKESGNEIFGMATHEQYTFPYYPNYLPDHIQRIEEVVRCLTEEGGCRSVFFEDGLFGNIAWER